MNIPALAQLDKTVKFSSRTRERFNNNSIGPVGRKVTPLKVNTDRVPTPYQKWKVQQGDNSAKVQKKQDVVLREMGETPMKCSSQLQKTMQMVKHHSKAFSERKINNFDNQVRNKEEKLYHKLNLKTPKANKVEDISSMFNSKIDFKKQVNKQLNEWSYFDGNINN